MAAAATYLVVQSALDPAAALIESEARFVGGLGLPVWLAWAAGGAAAGALGWAMGRITLGLRADYMAIATLGIAEIVKAFLKNADWLTKGTLTVSPLPWPVPTPNELGFVLSRSAYLSVVAILIVVTYVLLERAWHSPWGRMMRAIRDNELVRRRHGQGHQPPPAGDVRASATSSSASAARRWSPSPRSSIRPASRRSTTPS